MPPWKKGKEEEGAPAEDGRDRIGALPDALLHRVFSFLPSEDTVRTCVLAKRWRHLWKSATGLRIGCVNEYEPVSVGVLWKFVDHLFLLRGSSPLQTCEIWIGDYRLYDGKSRVNLWFRHAVMCKVRFLKLYIYENEYIDPWLSLDDLPLVSEHLTRLELHGVRCYTSFLNFSSCPALEHLEIEYCDISPAKIISSMSLKVLSISDSVFGDDSRIPIYAPNLVSLCLNNLWDRTPIFESMACIIRKGICSN